MEFGVRTDYGTEQGLYGAIYEMNGSLHSGEEKKRSDRIVREPLFAKKPTAFDTNHPFYQEIKRISGIRVSQSALRYGRQYMREISDNGIDFAMTLRYYGQPDREKELLAFSRILNDDELLIVLNANTSDPWKGHVVVDYSLNEKATKWEVIYSIKSTSAPASVKIDTRPKGSVKVSRVTGETTDGPVRTLNIALQPMEIQILKGITLH